MSYDYVASSNTGEVTRGHSELLSRDAVAEDLESRGLIVISIAKRQRVGRFIDTVRMAFVGGVSFLDKVVFVKHLSLMLRAGLTVAESVEILIEQSDSRRFRFVLESLHNDVLAGGTFASALLKFPRVFPPYVINVVAAGELSGTLEGNLNNLADQLTKENEMRQRVRTAMLYPAVVLVAALVIGYLFAIFVIPQVAALFTGLKGVELPRLTVYMIAVAEFVRRYSISSFVGLVLGGLGIVWFLRRPFMHRYTHAVILRLPVIGKISHDLNLARFSLVFSTLMRSGVDIITATKVTSTVVSNYYYRQALTQAAEQMMVGRPLAVTLGEHKGLFPKVVTRMVGVGERTGKLDEVLAYLSDFYQLEVETAMRNLATLLEPALLLFIGAVALSLAFSILIPIYNFITAIKGL